MLIPADAADPNDEMGRAQAAATILLLLNAHPQQRCFRLPDLGRSGSWQEILNTASKTLRPIPDGDVTLEAHTLALLGFQDQA
jgi:hypothetical protein